MPEPALVATYRLQLTPSFGLDAAAALVPYLAELGISHVYTSSYLTAAAGSTHGYDTVDHGRVSDELGGEEALQRFHAALREHGLGNVVDVVPNHMSVADAAANRRWWNVLRDGPNSADARFFDIDWSPPETKLAGKVLLAVLGRDYATELADGTIELVPGDEGGHEIRVGDLRFPVAPTTVIEPNTLAPPGSGADRAAQLHKVLEQQHYRLACWRVARDELDYRRFFDVTTLAGVRVEDPEVFAAVHERTLGWVRAGDVQGLRIDHPDGLRDPGRYLADLRAAAPDAWIVIEKILEPGEVLPAAWPVDGTTGYDVMRRITGLFVEPTAELAFTALFEEFTGSSARLDAVVFAAKHQALHDLFGTELTRLTDLAARCCEAGVVARDFSRAAIRQALEAMLVAMPVYRTYVAETAGGEVADTDRAVIAGVLESVRRHEPEIDGDLLGRLCDLLTSGDAGVDGVEFVARFQQLSGPAMAKGVEDTTFYRYNRLLALNEVGSDPGEFGVPVEAFHRESIETATSHPLTMSSTSTHDTKRSEDVRIRIALLTEMPERWRETVLRWRSANNPKWDGATPDRSMEYLLYQTLVAAHPLSVERTHEVLLKSMREAKQVTSWLRPTEAEDVFFAFSDALAADTAFQDELAAFVAALDVPARLGSLSQLAVKALAPGVPDFYQGSELWTDSLVDPDNRADVDTVLRRRLLDDTTASRPAVALADDTVGVTKLWLTQRLLAIRAGLPAAFVGADATYRPVAISGSFGDAAVGFCRGDNVVVVACTRPVRLAGDGWGDTSIELPPGDWRDALGSAAPCSGALRIGDLAGDLGIVVLIRTDATDVVR
ncbi:MAG: 1,4-alpha-D-glucan 1-alpha-D-glucosylmutase [Ilumatobacteraceae bacterium]|nr:1,4-alpha-D-glucan 1-alpha-D-glucosylmutase [Ilumatobacteraceae bacterium]